MISDGASAFRTLLADPDLGVNSQRLPDATGTGPGAVRDLLAGNANPADAGTALGVRAIARKDLYILSHPEQRGFLRRHAASQDAMLENDAWSPRSFAKSKRTERCAD